MGHNHRYWIHGAWKQFERGKGSGDTPIMDTVGNAARYHLVGSVHSQGNPGQFLGWVLSQAQESEI